MKDKFYILKIDSYQTYDWLINKHYAKRIPSISFAFGLYDKNNILQGVCTIGKPASPSLCVGVCGKENSKYVFELNRLCVNDGLPKNTLSFFVSKVLKKLPSLIIVSYADKGQNHNGYIYQATNFIYTGATKSRTDKYVEGGKHSRHYDNTKQNGLRKFRSSKHRYIYFTCNKKYKKKFTKALNYPVENYPKDENSNYILGEYIEPIILKDGKRYKKW